MLATILASIFDSVFDCIFYEKVEWVGEMRGPGLEDLGGSWGAFYTLRPDSCGVGGGFNRSAHSAGPVM